MTTPPPKPTKKERQAAHDLAHQRYAFASDAKRNAATRLAQVQADPNATADEITEATEALSEATALYRSAQAAVRDGRW
ncbi:hypothetical protein V1634_29130 [Plantactinospora veratri]|uniref:Uncharacterized protein n=1 Tax=Plantactinospora veratri TaxID=1436122 RepID=A0ABU7SLR4_9ACTN